MPEKPAYNRKMIDPRDEKLIGLLRLNARESIASLARKLGMSRSTVQDRIARLEESGIIKGYHVDLADGEGQARIRAFVTVSVAPQQTAMIVAELKTIHTINAIHTVSGKFDLVVEIGTGETEIMDKTLDRIGDIPGVQKTESSIVLSTKLQR